VAMRPAGVEAVGGLVEEEEARPVHQRLRELRHLLHAHRVGVDGSVARLAEADEEERLVSSLEGRRGRQPGDLAHQPDEAHAVHLGDERVALGHVADERPDLHGIHADVLAENAGRSARGRVEAEERVDKGRLAGAVRPEEPDRPPGQRRVQILQNGPAAEMDAETLEVDEWFHKVY
jgi:hypothetical protein